MGRSCFQEMGRWDDRFSEMGRLLNVDGTMGRSGVKSWVGQWDDLDSRKSAIGTLWGGMGHSGVDDGTLWGGTMGHSGVGRWDTLGWDDGTLRDGTMGHFDKPIPGAGWDVSGRGPVHVNVPVAGSGTATTTGPRLCEMPVGRQDDLQ